MSKVPISNPSFISACVHTFLEYWWKMTFFVFLNFIGLRIFASILNYLIRLSLFDYVNIYPHYKACNSETQYKVIVPPLSSTYPCVLLVLYKVANILIFVILKFQTYWVTYYTCLIFHQSNPQTCLVRQDVFWVLILFGVGIVWSQSYLSLYFWYLVYVYVTGH